MEKQLGNGNETKTGNENGKMEMEMGKKKCTNHWCSVFFIVCLSHYSCIVLSNGYRTGFMGNALPLLLYGHMEKQEMEMKQKLKMETETRN